MSDGLHEGKAFLGVGWAFPPLLENGAVAMARYERDIEQAIWIILGTNPGERLMRPDFGAGLDSFLFEPLNTLTLQRIRTRVRDALIDWEPRIDVEEVNVTVASDGPTRLDIEVLYMVRATNEQFNLVYPFYLDEGTAAGGPA